MTKKLTNRQRAFVEHYLRTWNATEAARQAGYSPRTANEQGSRLLANVSVQVAVDGRLSELKMGADEVLTRLAEHARGSIEDLLDASGQLNLAEARTNGKLYLVKKLKRTTRVYRENDEPVTQTLDEVELHDAQAALVHLGRHHKLFTDKHELSTPAGEPLEIGVRFIDYRAGFAAPEGGPAPDRDASQPEESP